MYIITKQNQKDYYDGVINTVGIDKTIVYKRKYAELINNDMPKKFKGINKIAQHINLRLYSNNIKYEAIKIFIISFCNKPVIGFKLLPKSKYDYQLYNHKQIKIIYDINLVKKLIGFNKFGKSVQSKFDDGILKIQQTNFINLHQKFKSPILIYESSYYSNNAKVLINPLLKEYNFYKIYNTYEAFQEISMFMGGVITNIDKPKEIADKYKITQHGFNKWSFRKESTKK